MWITGKCEWKDNMQTEEEVLFILIFLLVVF